VIAIRGIRELPGLVDDAHARLLRLDDDALDRVEAILHLRMEAHGSFDRGLRMKFRRVGDLEQHVLHHVAAVRLREGEGLALEQHVVEAPFRRRERGRINPSRP
jgi:hypothetical protein